MSHTTIAATRDYIPGRDKGDLTDPAQAASFTSDPLLTPITTSAMPKPMLPDPTPSDNPELFDKSTNHPNTHYHPDAKLSKKKRAKKLGTGYIAMPHGGSHGTGGVHAGGRTFSEHEKEAHERAERRDAAIGPSAQEQEEEWETDDDDNEAQEAEQSHRQSHENRITGTESTGRSQPMGKRNEDVTDSLKAHDDKKDDKQGGKDSQDEQGAGKEGAAQGEQGGDADKGDNPSLMQRASNVLSSAQQKATGLATGVTSSVMSTAQSVPLVGTLLSKMGLGAAKTDDRADDKVDDSEATADKQDDEQAGESGEQQQQGAGGSGSTDNAKEGSKVGGNREAETEGITKGAGGQSTAEAATRGGGEVYNKEGPRQDNNEGALDKSRSHAGQKAAANFK